MKAIRSVSKWILLCVIFYIFIALLSHSKPSTNSNDSIESYEYSGSANNNPNLHPENASHLEGFQRQQIVKNNYFNEGHEVLLNLHRNSSSNYSAIEKYGDHAKQEQRTKSEIKIATKKIEARRSSSRNTYSSSKHTYVLKDIAIDLEGQLYKESEFKSVYDPFSIQSLKYLSSYRNPCFWQEMNNADVYKGVLTDTRLERRVTDAMSGLYRKRLQSNKSGQNGRLRCLPSFFIAGVQKCGSTELYSILPKHRHIVEFSVKESHWWNRGRFKANDRKQGKISLEGYLDLFDAPAEEIRYITDDTAPDQPTHHSALLGDVSPALLWDQLYWIKDVRNFNQSEPLVLTPHAIHHILPDAKFILMLRNPTTRLYSDWLFFGGKKGTPEAFHAAIVKAVSWFNKCLVHSSLRTCTYNALHNDPYQADLLREKSSVWYNPVFRLRMGLYYVFIKDLLDVFPRNQVLIMRLEDYAVKRNEMLNYMFEFLDLGEDVNVVNHIKKTAPVNQNKKKYQSKGAILPQTKELLDKFYAKYNEQLANLLNNERYLWTE